MGKKWRVINVYFGRKGEGKKREREGLFLCVDLHCVLETFEKIGFE